MGFVWPIVDVATSATNPEVRRRGATEEPVPPESSVLAQPKAAPERKQKQQNNMLLLNAMRTTAAHSSMSFTAAQQALASADAGAAATSAAETPAARSQQSATPAPPATRRPTPKRVASDPAAEGLAPQPPVKGVPGAGKKKRKRESSPLVDRNSSQNRTYHSRDPHGSTTSVNVAVSAPPGILHIQQHGPGPRAISELTTCFAVPPYCNPLVQSRVTSFVRVFLEPNILVSLHFARRGDLVFADLNPRH